jgi:hypothetical protein
MNLSDKVNHVVGVTTASGSAIIAGTHDAMAATPVAIVDIILPWASLGGVLSGMALNLFLIYRAYKREKDK